MTNTPEKATKHNVVMLVDDSSIDNYVNKKIIQRYDFAAEVITYTSSRKALRHLLKFRSGDLSEVPVFIFLDLNMPEIDGYEFIESFSLLPQSVRANMNVVILTSSINPKDAELCSKHPAVLTFLHKPLVKNNLDALNLLISGEKEGLKIAMGA